MSGQNQKYVAFEILVLKRLNVSVQNLMLSIEECDYFKDTV